MSDPGPGSSRTPEGKDGAQDGEDGPTRLRPVVGGRTAARERALHLLYESQMKDRRGPDVLASQVLAADPYAERVVSGVDSHRDELDAVITDLLPEGWALGRLATLDLTVLRIACYELAHEPEVPDGVVLSEAVALAEAYGSDDSPRFVNGLLAAARSRLRPSG